MENYFDQLSAMNGAYIPNDDRDYPSLDKGDGLTKRFPSIKKERIDDAKQIIKDPEIVLQILKYCFPGKEKLSQPEMLANHIDNGLKQQNRASDVPLNPSGFDDFQ